MERSKIRDTDNTRTFYLAKFFIEYLLAFQQREAEANDKGTTNGRTDFFTLGLVAEMAELDSVRFVFGRMRLTMDDRVRRCFRRKALPDVREATGLDGAGGQFGLLHADRNSDSRWMGVC